MPNKTTFSKKLLQPISLSATISTSWKWLADFWGYLTILIFLLDFFQPNYDYISATGAAIIYTAILVIYVTNKEFTRWQKNSFVSQHFGEWFVILWTALLVFFIAITLLSQGFYKIRPEFYTTYITILGIFAISANSKNLKQSRQTNSRPKNNRRKKTKNSSS